MVQSLQIIDWFKMASDITARNGAEAALRESERKYHSLIESIDEGFCIIEVLFDARDKPIDYRFLETNPAFERQTGLIDAQGKTMRELAPAHEEHWFEIYGRVALSGEAARFENPAAQLDRWYDVYAWRWGQPAERQVAILFNDITARKQTEVALRESEERYRAIFEHTEHGFVVVEPLFDANSRVIDLRYLLINPAFEKHTGLRAADFVGKRLTQALPGIEQHWLVAFDRAAQTGKSVRTEDFNANTNRWYDVVIFPHPNGLLAESFVDVTARKKADQELRENEQRQAYLVKLGDALRPLADPIAIQTRAVRILGEYLGVDRVHYGEVLDDENTNVVHASYSRNASLRSLRGEHRLDDYGAYIARGFRAGQVIVVDDFAHLAELSAEQRAAYVDAGIAAWVGLPLVKDERLRAYLAVTDSAPRRWTEAEVTIMQETAERTWATVERARAEAALRESEARLRESDRKKDEFLAVLAHELRNPLAPIRTSMDLLDQARKNPALLDTLRPMMDRQLSHLIRLVDDLLDMSRISRGGIELRRTTLDLNHPVECAIEQVRSLLSERRHALAVHLSEVPLPVQGDFERLTQIVANLLRNAAKYTEPGGAVTVITAAAHDQALLRVRDTGIGIPREHLDRIFEMFVQVPEHRTLAGGSGGLGIGLALARQLIEMHGGSIAALSKGMGRGSEFVVRLPMSRIEERTTPAPHLQAGSRPLRRILIVDDNVDAAASLGMLLTLDGHTVEIAHDGPSALRRLEQFEPQIVLLDIGLPGWDGIEVARRIRDLPIGKSVRLVAVTGWGQEEDRRRTEEAGFDHHLTKPVAAEELVALIQHT